MSVSRKKKPAPKMSVQEKRRRAAIRRILPDERDFVVTAFAESAAGPGWSNAPLWVVVRDREGKYRVECLQPHEQSALIINLYSISQVVSTQMRSAVLRAQWEAKHA